MVQVAISVLDVNEENSVKTFYNLETAKPDFFHIDVMDGMFVEQNTMNKMRDYALKLHNISMTPIDVHLMVKSPMDFIDYFIDQGADRISFHLEACNDKKEVIDILKYLIDNGVKTAIAICPDTPVSKVFEYLQYLHMVVIMSVVPGKGGQKFIESSIQKIRELKEYCDKNNLDIDIEVDGGINENNAKLASDAGATILVSGNYIISSDDYSKSIKKLK